ncbi:MAG: hypothetical protein RML36_13655 [Anaerolineae bacterium]|nr:hypothetical protein [Anaerolineae bacterium]
MPEHIEGIATVNLGGISKLARDLQKELSEKKNTKGAAKPVWDDERSMSIHPSERLEDDKLRDHHYLIWNHHGSQ